MKNLFSIGEVSKIKGITIKALRYYHKVGILIPRYIDESSGYRYYSIDQFIYIDIIKGCRALGTSIDELQKIFKECNTDKLIEFTQIKRKEAEQNIEKMKEIIKNIDILNGNVKYSREILNNDDVTMKYFEERYVIAYPYKEEGELRELIYYSDLDKIIGDKGVEPTAERGIIYNIDSYGDIKPTYVFNGFKFRENIIKDEYIRVLPKGNYLTLSYTNVNEHERVKKIVDYAREYNLTCNNFIEVELLNDFFNPESYSCQLQMPI